MVFNKSSKAVTSYLKYIFDKNRNRVNWSSNCLTYLPNTIMMSLAIKGLFSLLLFFIPLGEPFRKHLIYSLIFKTLELILTQIGKGFEVI